MSDRKAFRDFATQTRDRSERDALRSLLKAVRMPKEDKDRMWRLAEQQQGLSIPIWNEVMQDFPTHIAVLPAAKMKDVTRIDRLFSKKRNNLLLKAHQKAYEQFTEEQDLPLILLIKLPYIESWMGVHNIAVGNVVSTRLSIRTSPTTLLFVEPLDDVAETLSDFMEW